MKLLIVQFSPVSYYFLLDPNILDGTLFLNTLSHVDEAIVLK
jgi:hypothetical protein